MKHVLLAVAVLTAALFAASGCTDHNPLSPAMQATDGRTLETAVDTCWDVEFRDTIASIDYGAGTFKVVGRTETIQVDGDTRIWMTVITRTPTAPELRLPEVLVADPAARDYLTRYSQTDSVLVFTDLKVGDLVEVKAKIVDAGTLLAVVVKLLPCTTNEENRCVEFTAPLASINLETRAVTFTGLSWQGTVCKGATLLDAAGAAITLGDFSVGQQVAVKGYTLDDITLTISEMRKL